MEKSIEQLGLMFDNLQKSDFKSFDEIKKLKDVMGVYVIFTENNELLYIGNTNKFHVRFGTDLRHESTHTLIKKLLKAEVHIDRKTAQEHFTHKYKYKIFICESKHQAEALEHLAIWMMNPKYNSHYISVVA